MSGSVRRFSRRQRGGRSTFDFDRPNFGGQMKGRSRMRSEKRNAGDDRACHHPEEYRQQEWQRSS
jgi:hypothetical protein